MTTTMSFPRLAPAPDLDGGPDGRADEMPTRRPSSRAERRAVAKASSFFTRTISS
jgi:hypothetical protein